MTAAVHDGNSVCDFGFDRLPVPLSATHHLENCLNSVNMNFDNALSIIDLDFTDGDLRQFGLFDNPV